MRTLLLDCTFDLPGAERLSFRSPASIFDFDLVFWDPRQSARQYPGQSLYRGKPSLSESLTASFSEDIARRRREFTEFLALGRTLVVFACPAQIFYVDTGERRTSGTGRNQKVTRLVDDADLLSALPFQLATTAARGLEMEPADEVVRSLWRETRDRWTYGCVLDAFPGDPILQISGTNRVVASLMTTKSNGIVAVMPEPFIPEDEDDDEDEDEDEGSQVRVDEGDGQEAGGTTDAAPNEGKNEGSPEDRFAVPKALLRWIQSFQPGSDEPIPDWAGDYLFSSELSRVSEVARIEHELAVLTEGLDELKREQAEDDQWKRLVFSDGTPLERQVQVAFEVLGFEVEEHRPGRSDFRLSHGKQKVVVEVKGATKSAAERHSAQLEKWVAEELAEGVTAKGILVVNAWREREPGDRPPAFPAQMLDYARARNHCLVTGLQLLALARTALENRSGSKKLARILLDTVGPLQGFDDPAAVFQRPPEITEATSTDA